MVFLVWKAFVGMSSHFLFAVCQIGAEAALKNEVLWKHSDFRFAYSRPGFVTFRIPDDVVRDRKFELRGTFVRTWGFSIGKVSGTDGHQLARDFWKPLSERYPASVLPQFKHLHVWQRDRELPGDFGYEPGVTPLADAVGELILEHKPDVGTDWPLPLNEDAQEDDRVLDCVLVEPNEWWFGWHRASSMETHWPGGVPQIESPDDMISRTYLKMAESLLWSELPIKSGDRCVEIGSAPGGSCQVLLERGCKVTGIDPAEMDPLVTAHRNFTHLRAKAKEVKRNTFQKVRWLATDANVAPKYTLDMVEAIVSQPDVRIEGLILTLKMTAPELVSDIPLFNKRIRSWGYRQVRARQLAFNRQEVCVVATDLKQSVVDETPRDLE